MKRSLCLVPNTKLQRFQRANLQLHGKINKFHQNTKLCVKTLVFPNFSKKRKSILNFDYYQFLNIGVSPLEHSATSQFMLQKVVIKLFQINKLSILVDIMFTLVVPFTTLVQPSIYPGCDWEYGGKLIHGCCLFYRYGR